ncbi:uncharacterized protein LACBIDRAFT_297377 [Laccaria bicolor S238N-H82]|uniref:Predicted protein n=1 Tax=Laccaria bicolor (strain S238N-H82 / ATCC MYA-4686) TaxID=486041 RepID=B0DAM7_LACBS|nr:uncharacterized protein LACBIDRAFT_297377 [Laccaria bicolor S238N-H82]EDR08561.1 predicted protein [Laccaria bicolor S238N-H82]|eukprot:XP_001880786.1 predicted protein [Laccaria bicolor S238N-H82]
MQITKEYLEKALEFLRNVEQEVMTTIIPSMAPVDVPAEGRTEHNTLLDVASAQCIELQPKLAAYLVLFGEEDLIRKLTNERVSRSVSLCNRKGLEKLVLLLLSTCFRICLGKRLQEATDGWATSIQNGLTSRQL